MKRSLIAAALVAVLVVLAAPAPAQAFVWRGPCTGWRNGQALRHSTPLAKKTARNKHLIRCVFNRFAPGEGSMAVYVAGRESNFDPWAWHHADWTHDCLGTFQQMRAYWPDRVHRYLRRRWFPRSWPDVRPFDPRANAIVAARMVRAGGWGPWAMTR